MSDSEAAPLSDALVDHQLSEESRGATGRQLGRGGVALPSSHTWDFGRLQLQVHVLLERADAGVHLHAQLVGRHPCSLGFFAPSVQTHIRQLASETLERCEKASSHTSLDGTAAALPLLLPLLGFHGFADYATGRRPSPSLPLPFLRGRSCPRSRLTHSSSLETDFLPSTACSTSPT